MSYDPESWMPPLKGPIMRSWTLVFGLALLLFTTGCQVVTNTSPVGTPSEAIARDLEGVWRVSDSVIHVKATATPGQLIVAAVQWDGQKMHIKQQLIHVGQIDDVKIISAQPEESNEKDYVFGLLSYQGNSPEAFMVLAPHFEIFQKAVQENKLKGKEFPRNKDENQKVRNDHLAMDITPEQWSAFFKDNPAGAFFDLKNPMIFTRISGVKIQDGQAAKAGKPGSEPR